MAVGQSSLVESFRPASERAPLLLVGTIILGSEAIQTTLGTENYSLQFFENRNDWILRTILSKHGDPFSVS